MNIKQIVDTANSRTGGYLIRRYISFLGHIVAMIIVMKLTWAGGLTENYFGIYVTFIAAHASVDKYISKKNPSASDAHKD